MSEPAPRPPRQRTREELFDLVRDRGELTRTDLVALTGISRSTINQSVSKLVADGRLTEVDNQAKGPGSGRGRPGVLLRALVSDAAVLGIDFGHAHVQVGLGDNLGRTIGSRKVALDVDLNATVAIDIATQLAQELRNEHGVRALSGVVAGIPGPLERSSGLVKSPTILSGWVGLAPAEELGRRIGTAVRVENDAVLGALGELHYGAGRNHENFLYVKASHGIGASVIINGRSYHGATGLAGEIGHTHLAGHTELCRCGNRGCLEAVVSVTSLREQIVHTRPGADPDVTDFAASHHPVTARILINAGRILGRVLADLCNLLNPNAVVIGGELGRDEGAFIDGVRGAILDHAQPATAAALEVSAATLGVDAELRGALQLATCLTRP